MCFVLNNEVPDDDFHKRLFSKLTKYLFDFDFEDLEEYKSDKDAINTISKYFKNSLKMFNVTNVLNVLLLIKDKQFWYKYV